MKIFVILEESVTNLLRVSRQAREQMLLVIMLDMLTAVKMKTILFILLKFQNFGVTWALVMTF